MRPLSSFSPVIRPGKPGLVLFSLLLTLLAAAACGGRVYLVTSLSLPHAIVVDGDPGDWSGALSYVAKDHLFVGFVNDRDNLFICLSKEEDAGRPGLARMGGWTVWVDPSGGTKKAFGLRIAPEGGRPGGESEDTQREPERNGRPAQKPVGEPVVQDRNDQAPPPDSPVELQWIGPNGEVMKRFSPEAATELGLEVGEGRSGGSYVLELKIPLKESEGHPFAIGAGPDSLIGVGFFSYRPERRDRRGGSPEGPAGGGGPGGGMPGGFSGGMGGGMGGRGGGMRGGMPANMNPDIAKAVKVWTRVRLLRSDAPGRTKVLDLILE